jgi:hypothetical protein
MIIKILQWVQKSLKEITVKHVIESPPWHSFWDEELSGAPFKDGIAIAFKRSILH